MTQPMKNYRVDVYVKILPSQCVASINFDLAAKIAAMGFGKLMGLEIGYQMLVVTDLNALNV